MNRDGMTKKTEKDTIFSDEELDTFKYMLYHANAGGQAINPPHPSWYKAANEPKNSPRRIHGKRNKFGKNIIQESNPRS